MERQRDDYQKKKRASLLAKFTPDMKCTICDEVFISVSFILQTSSFQFNKSKTVEIGKWGFK